MIVYKISFFLLKLYMYDGRVGVSIPVLTPPHMCTCLKQGHEFPTTYVVLVLFSVSVVKMTYDCWYWWNWCSLLFKLYCH